MYKRLFSLGALKEPRLATAGLTPAGGIAIDPASCYTLRLSPIKDEPSRELDCPPLALADMAELADALDSGSSGRKVVEVQVLLSALLSRVVLLGFIFSSLATRCPVLRGLFRPKSRD